MTRVPSYAVSILPCPSGVFTLAGSVPVTLCTTVPASQADVMGGRAHKAPDGSLQTWKVPHFPTYLEAQKFCEAKGVKIHHPVHPDAQKRPGDRPYAVHVVTVPPRLRIELGLGTITEKTWTMYGKNKADAKARGGVDA